MSISIRFFSEYVLNWKYNRYHRIWDQVKLLGSQEIGDDHPSRWFRRSIMYFSSKQFGAPVHWKLCCGIHSRSFSWFTSDLHCRGKSTKNQELHRSFTNTYVFPWLRHNLPCWMESPKLEGRSIHSSCMACHHFCVDDFLS